MNDTRTPRNILCVVVDRLQAGMVGAYGNTWIQTSGFDQLAAEGFLCERAIIDSTELHSLYRSYWHGMHAMAAGGMPVDAAGDESVALPNRLAQTGMATALVTDEPWLADHPDAADFKHRELLDLDSVCEPAEEIEQTQLARLFAVASARLLQLPQPFFLWVHAGSLGRVWDAPLDLRNRYAEEDDPSPSGSTAAPCRRLPDNFDPDELLTVTHAYAGQVTLLDICLSVLLDALADSPAGAETLVIVLSARGFPLGEHGRLGPCDGAIYSEVAQIPWLLRLPDGSGASERTQALVQPADLHATLADWCGFPLESFGSGVANGRTLLPLITGAATHGESLGIHYPRDRACIISPPKERAIFTPAWFLRTNGAGSKSASGESELAPSETSTTQIELFAKPEDRFEVNEVSNRAGDVAGELLATLAQFEQACQNPEASDLSPLPDVLVSGLE